MHLWKPQSEMMAARTTLPVSVRRYLQCFVVVVSVSLQAGCEHPAKTDVVELRGKTMGTSYSVTLHAPPQTLQLKALRDQIRQRLDDIESITSTYDPAAELAKFNAVPTTDWQKISDELCYLLKDALKLGELTDGAFDISVGAAVNLWGFGPGPAVVTRPTADAIRAAESTIGFRQVSVDCNQGAIRKQRASTVLDLSAYAKGYAVDSIAELLVTNGATNFLIEIGGEVRGSGVKSDGSAFVVGIEAPEPHAATVTHAIRLLDRAVATSGDYRNYTVIEEQRYAHTIDPRSAEPLQHTLVSVSVVDVSTATADALATALLVMGPDDGVEFATQQGLAVLFVIRDGDDFRHRLTPAFEALLVRT